MENYVKFFITFVTERKTIAMEQFIGEYNAKLDDKGRLVFPSAFKAVIDSTTELKFVAKKDLFAPCISIFTFKEWEKESESIKSKLNFFNKEHSLFWRNYMNNRATFEPDAKLGRITLPKAMLDSIGVQKEVVFAGNDYKIELWAKENYESAMLGNDEFTALAEKILGN